MVKHQQVRVEIPYLPPFLPDGAWEILAVEVEARQGTPQIPPPLGQHARLHRLPGGEGGQDGVEEAIRQSAQPIAGGSGSDEARFTYMTPPASAPPLQTSRTAAVD